MLIDNHIDFLDTGSLPCIPGLSSVWLGILLVTMIQVVGVSIIALVIPRLYDKDWSKLNKDDIQEKEDVKEKCQLVNVEVV